VREHRFAIEIPHALPRVWSLLQDYDRWTDFAPMVVDVEVVHPGDGDGNGLLRRVIYRLPFGRRGAALELVTEIVPERGYTYTMLALRPGNDQTGRVELEPLGPDRTRLRLEERYHLTAWPWRWLEGPIYGFINRQNERSMAAVADYLDRHPDYPQDLNGS
jgi:hypothetical protein